MNHPSYIISQMDFLNKRLVKRLLDVPSVSDETLYHYGSFICHLWSWGGDFKVFPDLVEFVKTLEGENIHQQWDVLKQLYYMYKDDGDFTRATEILNQHFKNRVCS